MTAWPRVHIEGVRGSSPQLHSPSFTRSVAHPVLILVAVAEWLAVGLPGRTTKTIEVNRDSLKPVLRKADEGAKSRHACMPYLLRVMFSPHVLFALVDRRASAPDIRSRAPVKRVT
jgi:hypothetical protein